MTATIGAMSLSVSLKVPGIKRIMIAKIRILLMILKPDAILRNNLSLVKNKIIEPKSKIKNKAMSICPSNKSCHPVFEPSDSGSHGRKNKIRTDRFIPKAVNLNFLSFSLEKEK